jgi:hypothetical protein
LDISKLKRYDQRNLIFNRIYNDPSWVGYERTEEEVGLRNIRENKPGYTRVDYALAEATWTVHDVWIEAFQWQRLQRPRGPSLMGDKWYQEKYIIEDPEKMTNQVFKAANFFGANLVGVTRINEKWVYANERHTLRKLELSPEVKFAIVMAVEMDEIGIATSPEVPAASATGICYSKMAFISSMMAEFIRNLGYKAVPSGNDTALSVPFAVDAGLGQLGRNGLLITPDYGPRIRLCKVFTDLPLVPDKPIEFGVTEYCRKCKKCAEACEAEAISYEDEPVFEPACKSNSIGILKWPVNGEKCYNYWCENGIDCSTCISVCPYNTGLKEASSELFWKNLS